MVGGSFVDIGGHNVWEAARFGIPVFFGPHYQSNVKLRKTACRRRGVLSRRNAEELADGLERALWTRSADSFAAAQALLPRKSTGSRAVVGPLDPMNRLLRTNWKI